MSAPGPRPTVEARVRVVYFSPAAGRSWLTKRAAYRAEARGRFFARCDCEAASHDDPGETCELHDPDGKYKARRESDGTTLTGRILRRWTSILIANDQREAGS